ncbi:heme ABC transporter ATP-binding protein [Pigmentiphaga sp. NML080357]|uniref:heme ABC transporter ATP-binding protein n=1 Tax=Pigmentiphaga sp. NML080357 TaxID=2008675 RepID=UPI000B420F87|nr:heme ABC transporter ATP-binding protein [Pigmentiphaga sp. NML080357]OVZ62465.1 heme ABC transporter ATP-binding protein [Pigmentiphaga sp. NML080357]
MLEVRSLKVARRQAGQPQPRVVLDGIDCAVEAGEIVMLIGPNGAGKSTLLATMAGDLAPAAGQVRFKGKPLQDWAAGELARQRAVLPQRAGLSLPFTVDEVVHLGCLARAESRRQLGDIVRAALETAGVSHLAQRSMPALSGGEQARVHLARVLAQIWPAGTGDDAGGKLLLLDEPCASLDPHHQHSVCTAIREFAHRTGAAVIVTMHDMNLAAQYADRIVALWEGKLIADGTPQAVLTREFVRRCFAVDAAHWQAGEDFLVATRPLPEHA